MGLKKATLELWVYTGLFNGSNKTENPQYAINKSVMGSNTVISFEISELIDDYINIQFDGTYDSISQSAWAEWIITRTYDDGTVDGSDTGEATGQTPINGSAICWSGYGYFEEGVNPDLLLNKSLMQTNTIVYAPSGEIINVPIFTGSGGSSKVIYKKGDNIVDIINEYTVVTDVTADMDIYTADTTNISADIISFSSSESEQVSIASSILDYDSIEIENADGSFTYVTVKYLQECKYNPNKVYFINKFGVVQELWFFKRRDDSMSVSRENYNSNIIQNGTVDSSYSVNYAQTQTLSVDSTKSIKLNTGFVDEQFGDVMKELMLTKNAWILENGKVYPIIPKLDTLSIKKSVNDKLIDYTLDFEYAFDTINNIR